MTERSNGITGSEQRAGTEPAAKRSRLALLGVIAAALLIAVMLGADGYLWIKAIHVVAIVSWMAGLLYLPRLFVYHADAEPRSELDRTLAVMEYRLLNYIMTPAMAIAWVLGLWLAYTNSFWSSGWFIAKVVLVIGLSGFHGYLAKSQRLFAAGQNKQPGRHWRLVNEIPTVLMIAIVILAVVKPF